MRSKKNILLFLLVALLSGIIVGCSKWDDYYSTDSELLEKSVWESIKEQSDLSSFVNLVEAHSLDTLFGSNNSYTIFVPGNAGMDSLELDPAEEVSFVQNHIVKTVFLLRNVKDAYKLKTLSGKYIVVEQDSLGHLFNHTRISSQSNLHKNGIYYTLEGTSRPVDNLFQYVQRTNPLIADYIEMQDSVYLDLELSRPVDINDLGQIIYDSVLISINLFELMFFPLSEEFRDNRATLVIPTEAQYLESLDLIKANLNLSADYEIPKVWQYSVIMPFIMNHGIFEGLIEQERFDKDKLKNIQGDSVNITYDVIEQYQCSNGFAYQYQSFSIPDSLYLAGTRLEGESLVEAKGLGLYSWKDQSMVRLYGETSFAPVAQQVAGIASNDSILYVDMGDNFNGEYAVEFKLENVFPGQYQCIWRSNPRSGGIYSIYIDGVLQTLPFDLTEFDLKYLSSGVISVTGSQYFYPRNGYNMLDCLTMVEEFGDVWIRIEYKGSGDNTDNGLIIDYVELVPYND